MSAYKELTKLSDINGGAIDEIFARNLAQVISNIADPATDAKAKRSIKLTIEMQPSDDRSNVEIVVKSSLGLASVKEDKGSMRLELTDGGEVVATVRDSEPGQMDFSALMQKQEAK